MGAFLLPTALQDRSRSRDSAIVSHHPADRTEEDAMEHTPVIGMTGYFIREEEGVGGRLRGLPGQSFSLISLDYAHAIRQAGGIPVALLPMNRRECERVLENVDGLVLTGGEDVDPRRYNGTVTSHVGAISPERDELEWTLLELALLHELPVLAICRGMQLLNVYLGGDLYPDVSEHASAYVQHRFDKAPRWHPVHRVRLTHPALRALYGSDEITVNSLHHQAVKTPGSGLKVAAVAEDGVIEALVHDELPHILAVQWHPEMMAARHEEGRIPFRWLVSACMERIRPRTPSH
jgi:putative glutamine amidotransferase